MGHAINLFGRVTNANGAGAGCEKHLTPRKTTRGAMVRKMKIYGCGGCGSEMTNKERLTAKKDNKQGFTCRFCCSKEPLEYLGVHEVKYND